MNNTYSSDIEQKENDKSNEQISLSASQLNDLEKEIMTKILDYFKENNNFPSSDENFPEIFYSPIGEEKFLPSFYLCNLFAC